MKKAPTKLKIDNPDAHGRNFNDEDRITMRKRSIIEIVEKGDLDKLMKSLCAAKMENQADISAAQNKDGKPQMIDTNIQLQYDRQKQKQKVFNKLLN